MATLLGIPKVWELLKCFKGQCQLKGYKTSEYGDWVKTGGEYHNFLWTRTVHPSTFEKIAMSRRFAIRKGISYQVVEVSYTAWVFPETPPEKLMQIVTENPELSKTIAIYDLSWAYAGKPVCLKLNETDSMVFREFEKFLEEKWGVKIQPAVS
ncbi:MAG: hypothetical protein OEX76_01495 [Candidatus Bathyarchaeota archaeon]|nr:hypothetical protein [Candidatus Bathyarchaeota archaeon]MDH5532342.1 hypothetical protein [Candidatus Bathyarchaeota archaeon]MDH5712486.1 hypothetical protein [Candidatus Bathyarchaeota archaeon]